MRKMFCKKRLASRWVAYSWLVALAAIAAALVCLSCQAQRVAEQTPTAAAPAPSPAHAVSPTPAAEPARDPEPAPPEREADFRFVVYGDSRSGHEVHERLIKLILRAEPELVLHTGDLVRDASEALEWRTEQILLGPLLAQCDFFPALGNHDLDDHKVPRAFVQLFAIPTRNGEPARFYSFDRGGLHFVALDTNIDVGPNSPQGRWLRRDLEETALPTIVYGHHPAYSPGPHGGDDDVREGLWPVLAAAHVVAYFCGHDHLYYRTMRDGVWEIVTAGGGAPLYDPRHKEVMLPGDVARKCYHFCLLERFGREIWLRAVGLDGKPFDAKRLR